MNKRSGKRLTLQVKLLVFSLVLSIVPVLVLGQLSSSLAARSVQEEVKAHHQTALGQIRLQVDGYVNRLDQISLSLASNETIMRSFDNGMSMGDVEGAVQVMAAIQNMTITSDVPFDVSLIMTQYNSIYSSRAGLMRQIDFPFNEIVKQMQSAHLTSLKVSPNTFANQSDLLIVRTVPINSASPKGILVLHLNVSQFQRMIEQTDFFGDRHMVIVDEQQRVIVGGDAGQAGGLSVGSEPLAAAFTALNRDAKPPERYIVSSVQSAVTGWTYIAVSPTEDVYQRADDIRQATWLLVLVIGLLWGLAAVVGSNLLLVPLRRLFDKLTTRAGDGAKDDIVLALDRYVDDMHNTNERLLNRLNEQMPVLKEHFLQQLIRGELSLSTIELEGKSYLQGLQGGPIGVGVAQIDRFIAFKLHYKERDRSQLMYALRKAIEEIAQESGPAVVFSPELGQAVFIVGGGSSAPQAEQMLRDIGGEIRDKVAMYFPFTVSVAVGEPREGAERIHEGYEEALSCLEYSWTIGSNAIITAKDVGASVSLSNKEMVKRERAIVASMAKGDFESAKSHLQELVQQASLSLGNSEAIRGLFAYLVSEIDDLLQQSDSDLSELLGGDVLKQLYSLESLRELEEWFGETVLPAVQNHAQDIQVPKQKKAVQHMLAAVHEQFETDLSLQKLVDELQISQPTLSRWFKEETGQYFGDYLIYYRMEKAKMWLIHTDMPIKEIAERLRYTSAQNFSRIFKQTSGIPPGSYRTMRDEE